MILVAEFQKGVVHQRKKRMFDACREELKMDYFALLSRSGIYDSWEVVDV